MLNYELIEKFVINLKRRPDRLKKFRDTCPLKDVKVIYGFDGSLPGNEESEKERKLFNNFSILRPGERGVFISHLRIYHNIVENKIPFSLIMEDDAIFCKDFYKRCLNVLYDMPNTTDLLYIGGRFESEYNMKACTKVSNNIVRHNVINKKFTGSHMDCDRTMHAYIISNRMANILLNTFYSTHITIAIDDWILRVSNNNSIPVYNAQPLLCHSPLVGDSNIR